MDKKLQIRNSTVDFLVFTRDAGELDEDSTCANFAQVADNGKTLTYIQSARIGKAGHNG